MKLKYELSIDADRAAVWAAFNDVDKLSEWQPTLADRIHKSGIPGTIDAVSELVYEHKGRAIKITETITECRKPDFVAATYETPGDITLTVNTFEERGPNRTHWSRWSNVNFKGIAKLSSMFRATAMRKRMEDDMLRFKLLVESEQATKA